MLMMLPFEAPTIFEGIHKSYFRMPRVVKDQRSRFENDDLFRQLSHESEVKYTGFKDRPVEERQMKFIANCEEGHTEVSVVQSGNQFTLMFNPAANPEYNNEGCDFNKELGKVHIKAGFILNGVCVLWTGWIDLQRLEGFGRLEFDEYRAYLEEAMTKQQLDSKQCNNNSQISRLNHHMGPMLPPQSSFNQAAAAAAAVAAITTNTMLPPPPLGLNTNCLGQPHPNSLSPGANSSQLISSLTAPPPPPPVSLADSAAAAHYGNAAIAAAAAAAFHQALSVGGGGGLPPPPHQQSLHPLSGAGVGGPAPSTLAAVAASNGLHCQPPPPPPHSLVPPHLTYTNGSHMIPSLQSAPPQQHQNTSPHLHTSPQHHNPHHHHHHHSLNGSQTNGSPGTIQHHINSNQMRSPERENHHQHHHHQHHHNNNNNNNGGGNNNNHFSKRQAIKRPQEEQTQIDEVDVVSDISAHDLDFPPKRIFKSDSMTSHHNHHHKISRRAA